MASTETDFPVLVLGAEGSGKTLLLKCMQFYYQNDGHVWDFGSVPKHAPTVGVELANFIFPFAISRGSKRKKPQGNQPKINFCMRELGGQMSPLWSTYLKSDQCKALIFCIDASNPFQASTAAVQLSRCLQNGDASWRRQCAILIIFTKSVDLQIFENDSELFRPLIATTHAMTVMEMWNMMCMGEIMEKARENFKSVDVITRFSAVNGTGLEELFAWLNNLIERVTNV